jgi:acyl-CoA oxidase
MPITFPKHLKPIEPQGPVLLQQERDRASFNSNELMNFIYGKEHLETRDRLLNILQNDPILSDKSHRYYNGRDVRFNKSLAGAKRFAELSR